MISRRIVLQGISAAAVAGAVSPGRLAFGAAPTDNRLAFVILRGALDGLEAAPPYADRKYRSVRPNLAVPAPGNENGALDLDGYFGLHSALAPLHPLYKQKQLLIIPAATTAYRQRSHFDGQNVLENGTDKPSGVSDGWLNRALVHLNDGDRRMGLSVGHVVPLVMRGEAAVRTWAPSNLPQADGDFLTRLAYVYANDRQFAEALRLGRQSQAGAAGLMDNMAQQRRRGQFKFLAQAAGRLLAEPDGPRIAVLEAGGWDTHVNQRNRLNKALRDLADGLVAFKKSLGPAWDKTAVVVVSEFGRTVTENGTRGTDHGVGGIAILLGGAVAGGRIGGDWRGLANAQLYEGRDIKPTTDYRSIFKAALSDHIGLSEGIIEDKVFPASRSAPPMDGIIRRV